MRGPSRLLLRERSLAFSSRDLSLLALPGDLDLRCVRLGDLGSDVRSAVLLRDDFLFFSEPSSLVSGTNTAPTAICVSSMVVDNDL